MSLLLLFSGGARVATRFGGDRITGGTFSRKRWHDLLSAEEAREQARERAERVKERLERAAQAKAQAEARAEREAARAAQDRENALSADLRSLAAAAQAQHGALTVADIMRNSTATHAAIDYARRQHEADDEDEAIALLLGT